MNLKQVIVLGIESSCDETGIALIALDSNGQCKILSEAIASQIDVHALYGGVVPEIASREHLQALPLLCEEVILNAGIERSEIAAVAVTVGPGLKGCLLVGLVFAQAIAASLNIPLIPVNHIEGHLVSHELTAAEILEPYLALIVSGGHTELLSVSGFGKYSVVSRTRDDAAGEAFDKSAALLGFPYPGGAQLAALADTCSRSRFVLPKVSREMDDFSFSGLKTAVLLQVTKNRELVSTDPAAKSELAFSVQRAIVDALVHKVACAREVTKIKKLIVAGGVSLNSSLRSELRNLYSDAVVFPEPRYCTDNGAMIALAGAKRFLRSMYQAQPVEVKSRWPVEEIPA